MGWCMGGLGEGSPGDTRVVAVPPRDLTRRGEVAAGPPTIPPLAVVAMAGPRGGVPWISPVAESGGLVALLCASLAARCSRRSSSNFLERPGTARRRERECALQVRERVQGFPVSCTTTPQCTSASYSRSLSGSSFRSPGFFFLVDFLGEGVGGAGVRADDPEEDEEDEDEDDEDEEEEEVVVC